MSEARLEKMAQSQIEQHYPHLADARIRWYFVDGSNEPHFVVDCPKFVIRDAGDFDFVVSVKEGAWDEMEIDAQEMLIDNVLARMGMNDGSPFKRKPDCVFFSEVAQRRGLPPDVEAAIAQLKLPLKKSA